MHRLPEVCEEQRNELRRVTVDHGEAFGRVRADERTLTDCADDPLKSPHCWIGSVSGSAESGQAPLAEESIQL